MMKSKLDKNEIPLVSVITPTYKRPEFLERAIESVKQQTYGNIEHLIIDDNNADTSYREETEQLMNKYSKDSRIRYIKHSENKNGAAARNTGIKNAKGKYITFLDDDDEYYRGKIAKQVRFLEINNDFDAVYCGWSKNNKEILPKYTGDVTFQLLSGQALIITDSIMITKESAIAINGWDETFRRNQEAALMLRFFRKGYKIGAISESLIKIHVDDRSNASKPRQMEEDFNHFLSVHREQIESSAKKENKNKYVIYSHRYRGVIINYLKHKDFRGMAKLYFKMMRIIPIRFNKDLLIYIFKKIQSKHVYD